MSILDLTIAAAKVVLIFSMLLTLVPVLIWMERKGAAYIQDRRGPNRAEILGIRLGGLIHSLADAIKLLTKEDITVGAAYKPLYLAAPMLALFVATVTIAVVPFAEPLRIGGLTFSLQIADLKSGLIYVFAMGSLGVYALILAGWSSGGKYSLLAALRASSQMISYELAMGMSALAIFIVAGSFSLPDIIADQGAMVWRWNAVRQPLAFVIFFAAMLAETNRLPFDLPEGESELVAGYHTEYSSMRFAMFFMGEYAHIIAGSAILAAVFFGGWQFPFVAADAMRANAQAIIMIGWPVAAVATVIAGNALARRFKRRYGDRRDFEPLVFGLPVAVAGLAALVLYPMFGWSWFPGWAPGVFVFAVQLGVVLAKTIAIAAVFIWIRWTLPRFRYDQLMRLGWKVLLPLSMANVLATAVVVLLKG
ncbi:MAG: complex I subunit 1 family protein [Pseudomonadota bacterium]